MVDKQRAAKEGKGNMKAKVDQDVCIGCTLCVETCPEVFRMDNEKSSAYAGIVPVNAKDRCRKAADECPVAAISIVT